MCLTIVIVDFQLECVDINIYHVKLEKYVCVLAFIMSVEFTDVTTMLFSGCSTSNNKLRRRRQQRC